MATTTNYGWETADDTDLVKDGALAMRTLGSAIDTTTKALNPSTTLGDIEYRSATANTNTRLGIGSTGDVLTVAGGVPTWAAPAASGGLILINTTSFSAVSSQSLNDVFSSTYDTYKIVMDTDTSASNVGMTMRMRVGGADHTSASYVWDQGLATGNVQIAAETTGNTPQTSWFFFGSGGIPSAHSWELYRPFETNNTGFTGLSYYIDSATGTNTNHAAFFRAGATTVTTSFDGFTFFVASGTMTGKVSVYGYAK